MENVNDTTAPTAPAKIKGYVIQRTKQKRGFGISTPLTFVTQIGKQHKKKADASALAAGMRNVEVVAVR